MAFNFALDVKLIRNAQYGKAGLQELPAPLFRKGTKHKEEDKYEGYKKLKEYKELLDEAVITEEEYAQIKAEFIISDEKKSDSAIISQVKELKKLVDENIITEQEFSNEKNKILKRCVNIPKMQAAIARLKKKITGNQNSLILNRQISSLGMNGVTRFDTYESLCSELWLIKDSRHIGGIFLSTLLSELKALCCEIWVSQTPLLEIEAIYLPNCGIAITNSNDERKNSKIINTERFIISKEFSAKRTTLKFLFNLQKELYKKVNELFSEIKKIHFTLEEIYKSAMDFSFSEEISKEILEKIDK